jgi:hypothetical protein
MWSICAKNRPRLWMCKKKPMHKEMDSRGIEPRTTPMLREYYTTKPRARVSIVTLYIRLESSFR